MYHFRPVMTTDTRYLRIPFAAVVLLAVGCAAPPSPAPPSPAPEKTSTPVARADNVATAEAILTGIEIILTDIARVEIGRASTATPSPRVTAPPQQVPVDEWVPIDELAERGVLSLDGTVRSGAALRFALLDGSEFAIAEETVFTLVESRFEGEDAFTRVELQSGGMWVNLKRGGMQVMTDAGSATVSGSMLGVFVSSDGNRLEVTCLEGAVTMISPQGESIVVPPGHRAQVMSAQGAPSQTNAMGAEDTLAWAINMPQAIAVMPRVVPQEALVTLSLALPMDDPRGREALLVMVETLPEDTLELVVPSLPIRTLSTLAAALGGDPVRRDTLSVMLNFVSDEQLLPVVTLLSAEKEQRERLSVVIDALPEARLGTLLLDLGAQPEHASVLRAVLEETDEQRVLAAIASANAIQQTGCAEFEAQFPGTPCP